MRVRSWRAALASTAAPLSLSALLSISAIALPSVALAEDEQSVIEQQPQAVSVIADATQDSDQTETLAPEVDDAALLEDQGEAQPSEETTGSTSIEGTGERSSTAAEDSTETKESNQGTAGANTASSSEGAPSVETPSTLPATQPAKAETPTDDINTQDEPLTGERYIDGHWYYYDESGNPVTGWHTWADGTRSYYGPDGAAFEGIQIVDGKTYYFDKDKACHTARWEQRVGEKVYYFDGNYVMHTGWLTWNSDKTRSYFGVDGAAYSGWSDVDGKRYYFDSKNWNHGYRWEHWIEGKMYYFDGDCSMRTGWLTWNSDKTRSYFGGDGAAYTGWSDVGGKRYYFDSKNWCHGYRWERRIDDKVYYFDGSCAMHTGWLTWNSDKTRSYFGADGVAISGWLKDGSKRYYADPKTFRTVRWERWFDDKLYYFDYDTHMHTGWLTWNSDKSRSYFGSDGAAYSGLRAVGGKTYYFNPKNWNHTARWEQIIDGKMYYFDGDYAMHTGWLTWNSDKTRSYFGSDGVAYSGWRDIDGKRYYFDDKNWNHGYRWEHTVGDNFYYFDGSCAMHTGWLTWNSDKSRSYFNTDKSSDDYGAMLYGVQTIDGVPYDFGTSGKYYPQSIMGATQTTVAQMVRYYLANVGSSAYPTSVYTSKGAKTINDFCQILYEEAKAEGVRAEVLYAQVMLETGGLQFGRKVKAEQCNFGGIGATDTNPHPATFKNVREGLRAQTQHLKAYASTAPLNNACVDPRFNLVSRGSATTVYALAGKWASNTEYGKLLTSIMASLLKS